jgi:hypothetical protein
LLAFHCDHGDGVIPDRENPNFIAIFEGKRKVFKYSHFRPSYLSFVDLKYPTKPKDQVTVIVFTLTDIEYPGLRPHGMFPSLGLTLET